MLVPTEPDGNLGGHSLYQCPPHGPGIELETFVLRDKRVSLHRTPGQGFFSLATERSHLDIPGYNVMTLTKG